MEFRDSYTDVFVTIVVTSLEKSNQSCISVMGRYTIRSQLDYLMVGLRYDFPQQVLQTSEVRADKT